MATKEGGKNKPQPKTQQPAIPKTREVNGEANLHDVRGTGPRSPKSKK